MVMAMARPVSAVDGGNNGRPEKPQTASGCGGGEGVGMIGVVIGGGGVGGLEERGGIRPDPADVM